MTAFVSVSPSTVGYLESGPDRVAVTTHHKARRR